MANLSHHTMAERTLPHYADTSKLEEVEELESLGVLSRSHFEEKDTLDKDPYGFLNTTGSKMFSAVSMQNLESQSGHRKCTCGKGHQPSRTSSHHSRAKCTCKRGSHSHPTNSTGQRSHSKCTCGKGHKSSHTSSGQQQNHPDDLDEIREAVKSGESQMTVYNPDEVYTSMAPRTNNLNVRQTVIAASFMRDLDSLETEEFGRCDEHLRSFHESRRHDMTAGGTSFFH